VFVIDWRGKLLDEKPNFDCYIFKLVLYCGRKKILKHFKLNSLFSKVIFLLFGKRAVLASDKKCILLWFGIARASQSYFVSGL
jgi:hypothetical protein